LEHVGFCWMVEISVNSIGKILKGRRESLGISLKEAEKATKIRVRHIQALENDEFNIIPGRAYVKGFLRTYATFLRIDVKSLLKDYEKEHDVVPKHERDIDVNKNDLYKKRRMVFFFIIGFLLLIVVIFFGARALSRRSQNAPKQKNEIEVPLGGVLPPEEEQVKEEPVIPVENKPVTGTNIVDTTSLAEKPAGKEFKIKATALDRVWLRVIVDGENVFESVLEKDESKEWVAKESVIMKSGNGDLVQIVKDGELIGKLSVGLEEKKFTAE